MSVVTPRVQPKDGWANGNGWALLAGPLSNSSFNPIVDSESPKRPPFFLNLLAHSSLDFAAYHLQIFAVKLHGCNAKTDSFLHVHPHSHLHLQMYLTLKTIHSLLSCIGLVPKSALNPRVLWPGSVNGINAMLKLLVQSIKTKYRSMSLDMGKN
ncbi:uncharacterized protein PGTG_14038 [Puccinia graminis f. sp. tritici CRL 75-36-700-3]|uniref:Uncharacterized protein n=1 Tax=Puccinia graminis f. sp. tritici (strain CRL 75-36-700-3 / race SCCL) TaxID=418459 RepID=E3KVY5_PUCGT|nr:uncharacterized protein PGTG_14038 [Puccinia graminis f. sp. tritici CRL 75-36-700-3]EFP88460.1 hypothetical protein PGTG_14038 [Puccinia graminis f. sp. tritici CRL 75-36-700-3]